MNPETLAQAAHTVLPRDHPSYPEIFKSLEIEDWQYFIIDDLRAVLLFLDESLWKILDNSIIGLSHVSSFVLPVKSDSNVHETFVGLTNWGRNNTVEDLVMTFYVKDYNLDENSQEYRNSWNDRSRFRHADGNTFVIKQIGKESTVQLDERLKIRTGAPSHKEGIMGTFLEIDVSDAELITSALQFLGNEGKRIIETINMLAEQYPEYDLGNFNHSAITELVLEQLLPRMI